MRIVVVLTIGLVFWVTAWTFGIKALDASLVVLLLLLGVVAYQLFIEPVRNQLRP